MSSPPNRFSFALAALALSALLTACSGYLDNGDTVSRSAGDAVDANAAIHTIDPWPLAASSTEILSDGRAITTTTTGASSATAGGDAASTEAMALTTPASASTSSQGAAGSVQGGSNQ
jgi:hypothetical protein